MIQAGQTLAFELIAAQGEAKTIDLGKIIPIGEIEARGGAVLASLSVGGEEFVPVKGGNADGATARYVRLECADGNPAAVCVKAGDGLMAQACPCRTESCDKQPLPDHVSGGMSVTPVTLGKRKGQFLAVFPSVDQAGYIAYAYGQTPWGPFTEARRVYCVADDSRHTGAALRSAKTHSCPSCPDKMFVSYDFDAADETAAEADSRLCQPHLILVEDTSIDPLERMLSDVYVQRVSMFRVLNRHARPGGAVVTGDSLIHEFPADELLGGAMPVCNRGIGGDTTAGLLKRLDESILALRPSRAFVLIGTNDIAVGRSDDEIEANYEKLICSVARELTDCRIHVISLLPVNSTEHPKINMDAVGNRPNERIAGVNARLKYLARRHGAAFVDVHGALADSRGQLALPYTREGLHLSPEGNEVMAGVLRPYLH